MLTRSVACARVLTYAMRKAGFRVADPQHLEQHKGGWSTLSCQGTCEECGDTTAKVRALKFAEMQWNNA